MAQLNGQPDKRNSFLLEGLLPSSRHTLRSTIPYEILRNKEHSSVEPSYIFGGVVGRRKKWWHHIAFNKATDSNFPSLFRAREKAKAFPVSHWAFFFSFFLLFFFRAVTVVLLYLSAVLHTAEVDERRCLPAHLCIILSIIPYTTLQYTPSIALSHDNKTAIRLQLPRPTAHPSAKYIRTYVHTYIHTYIQTYTHTQEH